MRHALLLILLLLIENLLAQPPGYDVLVVGGRIVDGAGNPWFYGDLAITGDMIAAIGPSTGASAKLKIDASGLTVAPGFIDIHSHARRAIFKVPTAENYVRQGATTLVEGPDGSSPLPLRPFLDKLSHTPISVNIGLFVGQGTIRRAVLGLENRKATPAEIQKMKELAEQGMYDGAFGLSTGLFYVPGNYTPTEEVIELARVAGRLGGMHISHIREESSEVLDSVRETVRIGEEGGLPTQITHHKIVGRTNWGRSVETLRLVEEARARGVDVTIDQYPYTATSTGTTALFPQWSLEGGRSRLMERLKQPELRSRIKEAIVARIRNDRGGGDPRNVVMAHCSFDPTLAGKNLRQLTEKRSRLPTLDNAAETAIEIQEQGGCQAIYHALDEGDLEQIMRYPFTMVASDGEIPIFGKAAPHPRSYGTFARVLGHYVRQRRVLKFEEAVRRMSSLPAGRLRLLDRGLLRPGMKADVVVFDAATVIDKATFGNPHQYATGIRHVFVNGKPVLLDGKMTRERPGRVLYGPAYVPGIAPHK
jgi:dihydroorotase/N-acyl-D-amino-acid deacylase